MCSAAPKVEMRDPQALMPYLLPADLPEIIIEPFRLLRCEACGWWGIEEKGADTDNKDYYYGFHFLVSAVSRWFDIDDKDVPVSALRDYFRRQNALDFKVLHPWAFERLVAECLKYEFGPCEVHHVGVSGGGGDGGVDIYLIKDATEWLIQVKRRLNEKPEPIETIRLLNGVLLREGKCRGMVVTSSKSFSRNALSETEVKTAGPYAIKLIDRGGVLEMFSKVPSFDLDRFLTEEYPKVKMSPVSEDFLLLLKGTIPKELDGEV
jgi:hypothetical protein